MFGKTGWSSKFSIAGKKKMIELIPILLLVIVWNESWKLCFDAIYGYSQGKKTFKEGSNMGKKY